MSTAIRMLSGAAAILLPLSAGAQPVFVDQTVAAGLAEVQWDGDDAAVPAVGREMARMTAAAAAADFDQDGWVDLFVSRFDAPSRLYRNRGDGSFTDEAALRGIALTDYASGCGWGDVDNDGDLDLYVMTVTPSNRNYLYIYDHQTGQFTEQAVARGVDLTGSPSLARGFSSPAFGDFDKDGDLDLYVTDWGFNPSRNLLFVNDGTGHFSDQTAAAGVTATTMRGFTPRFTDIDADGWPDLLVAGDFGTSKLFHNNGDGTFSDVTASAQVGTDENGMGATTADIDGDGRIDWFITSIWDPNDTCAIFGCNWGGSGNRMFRNNGALAFADWTDLCNVRDGAWGWATSVIDHDNDGDLDLVMTNGVNFPWTAIEEPFRVDRSRFFRNEGGGIMTEIGEINGIDDRQSGKGLIVFDYDNDGDQDIFIANNAATPILYRNDGGNQKNWLQVELRGRDTNSHGIGAWVYVRPTPTSGERLHEMSASSNFQSQNPPIAHFGVESETSIDLVRVEWPISGYATVLRNVQAGQTLEIGEPGLGDCNGDGVTDAADLVCYTGCVSGPQGAAVVGCRMFDQNTDTDVDVADYAALTLMGS